MVFVKTWHHKRHFAGWPRHLINQGVIVPLVWGLSVLSKVLHRDVNAAKQSPSYSLLDKRRAHRILDSMLAPKINGFCIVFLLTTSKPRTSSRTHSSEHGLTNTVKLPLNARAGATVPSYFASCPSICLISATQCRPTVLPGLVGHHAQNVCPPKKVKHFHCLFFCSNSCAFPCPDCSSLQTLT